MALRPFRCVIVLRPLLGVVGQASPANELDGRFLLDVIKGQTTALILNNNC